MLCFMKYIKSFLKEEVAYESMKLSKIRLFMKMKTGRKCTMDKKTEKVIDSILSVLIAIVGEILTNQNKEESKKESE